MGFGLYYVTQGSHSARPTEDAPDTQAQWLSEGQNASLGWRGRVNHNFSLSFLTTLPWSEFLLIPTLLIFSFFIFDHTHVMWGLSSPTRDRTCAPCIGRQSLNHRTAGEVPPHL